MIITHFSACKVVHIKVVGGVIGSVTPPSEVTSIILSDVICVHVGMIRDVRGSVILPTETSL